MGLPAARVGDLFLGTEGSNAHGGPLTEGSPNVLTNNIPSSRVTDDGECDEHGTVQLITGSPTVLVNGLPFSRLTDAVNCDAVMITGSPNVLVG